MPVQDGPSCLGCGLPNYAGMCPHCRGDAAGFKDELVPPFGYLYPWMDEEHDNEEAERGEEDER